MSIGSRPLHLLFRLLDFFLADLFTDGRLLHTEDIGTSFSQLLQAALDIQAGRVDLVFGLPVSDAAVPLLQPARIQQANSHVLLHLAGWDLLASDWRDEVLVLRCNRELRLGGCDPKKQNCVSLFCSDFLLLF